jgi:hypothetical protein
MKSGINSNNLCKVKVSVERTIYLLKARVIIFGGKDSNVIFVFHLPKETGSPADGTHRVE